MMPLEFPACFMGVAEVFDHLPAEAEVAGMHAR